MSFLVFKISFNLNMIIGSMLLKNVLGESYTYSKLVPVFFCLNEKNAGPAAGRRLVKTLL